MAPGGIVHLAYYAMFQAARAVLVSMSGTSPKKHAGVINQFGLLAKDRSAELRLAGDDLNKVQARRLRADYNETAHISPDDAKDAFRKAEDFLDLCASEFGFPRGKHSRDA